MTSFFIGLAFLLLFAYFVIFKLPGIQAKIAKEQQDAIEHGPRSTADVA